METKDWAKEKGIEYCNRIKNDCSKCPLVNRVCISAPYGLFLVPDRKMDYIKFINDFVFMLEEIGIKEMMDER